jgi:ABC-type transport system substrate-binding protein
MKKTCSKKLGYLGLSLCIIASLFVFACNTTEPATIPAMTPTTPIPTTPTTTSTPTTTGLASTEPAQTSTSEQPKYGGTLSIISNWAWTENIGYPPLLQPAFQGFIPAPSLEVLLRLGEDGLPHPWLVTGWEWTSDKQALMLTLRQGVKFQDGTDFNADSVKYMLNLMKTGTTELADVSSIEVIDDYTLKLNMKKYSNTLLYDLCAMSGGAGATSASAIKINGQDWALTHPIGTGPFKFVSYQRDVQVKFEKWDGYWQEGKPYLDKVEYSIIKDPVIAGISFQAGEGNAVVGLTSVEILALQKAAKYDLLSYPTRVNYLLPDSSNPDSPFNKLEVRQAISYAIDGETLVSVFGNGLIPYTNQICTSASSMYNPDITGYPYNPEKAKELLAEAGYPDGFNTKIYYQTGLGWESAATMAQGYLDAVGIKVELQPLAAGARGELMVKGWENSMLLYGAYQAGAYVPLKTLTNYFSQSSVVWPSIYHPDEIQDLLDSAMTEPDPTKVIDKTKEINRLMIDKYCLAIPMFSDSTMGAADQSVQDSNLLNPKLDNWTPEQAWIDK